MIEAFLARVIRDDTRYVLRVGVYSTVYDAGSTLERLQNGWYRGKSNIRPGI